jgi:hypothetical protein
MTASHLLALCFVLTAYGSIQVAVRTNVNTSTSMVTVDTVTSWSQLVTACAAPSANIITLSPTFQMGVYTNEIDFSGKTITIFGSSAILDAGQKGTFFTGDGSKGKTSLELHDITFQNGKDSTDGGAIRAYNSADVEVYTSQFIGNYCDEAGGAINARGANVEIHDTIFLTNTASNGGAIAIISGDLKIHGTIFQSNSGCGAIYVLDKNKAATAEIYDSTFESNHESHSGGGALFVDGSLAAFNCTFHGNTASLGGGAAYMYTDGNAIFTGCIFNGNDGTKGHNDITRKDDSSNVTFACANGTVGAPVTMKAGESEMVNPPPVSLKCTLVTNHLV